MTRDAQIIFESYRAKHTKVLTESRCEDYPCCGHEQGGCPDEDGAFGCASCGSKMPKGNRSAICNSCHKRHARSMDDADGGPYDNEDNEDGSYPCPSCGAGVAGRLHEKLPKWHLFNQCGKCQQRAERMAQELGDTDEAGVRLDAETDPTSPFYIEGRPDDEDNEDGDDNYISRRHDDNDDRFDDERPRRRNRYSCSDRMCGATDCSTCYPGDNPSDEDSEEPIVKKPASKQNRSGHPSGRVYSTRDQKQAKHQAQLDRLKQMKTKGMPEPMSGDKLIAALKNFIINNPPYRDEDNVVRPSPEDVMKLIHQTRRQDADYFYSNLSAD